MAITWTTKQREVIRLLVFCAVVLGGAALIVRPLAARREPFDRARLDRLRERQPEFVLVGDSLLGYSVDPAVLESTIGGKRVDVLWHGGAASAAWFFYLKNFVAASGIHPRRVFIFIHDDVLTDPGFRTTGKHAQTLQRLMRGDESLFRTLTRSDDNRWWLQRWIAALFPVDQNRAHYQQKVDGWARRAVAIHRDAARRLEADANASFDLPNLRADQPVVRSDNHAPFEQMVGQSFLPHMIALARAGNYSLCFVRPKKRPGPDAAYDDSSAMRTYYAALRRYLQTNGCDLVDFTHDSAITPEMFSDSVHIGPWAMEAFTKHFAARLADKFQ